jgi:hypothetical protein
MARIPRRMVLAFLIAAVLTGCLVLLTDVPHCGFVGVLFAPAMILAALVFPEGAHSSHGDAYLITAGVLMVFMLWWPVLFVWQRFWPHRLTES